MVAFWKQAPLQARRLRRECLQKDAKDRLRDIGDAKRQLVEEAPPVAVPTSVAPSSRIVARHHCDCDGIVLAMALGALGFVHFREEPPVAEVTRFQIPPPEKNTIGFGPLLSPDGRRVVFHARGPDGRNMLWIRLLDSIESRPLTGTEGLAHVRWDRLVSHCQTAILCAPLAF